MPERSKKEPYGCPADIWAVGLTLMTVALGRCPITDNGRGAAMFMPVVRYSDRMLELLDTKASLHCILEYCSGGSLERPLSRLKKAKTASALDGDAGDGAFADVAAEVRNASQQEWLESFFE